MRTDQSQSKWFFTADEHYYHQSKNKPERGIINYCNRPFDSIDEMHHESIKRHNEIVPVDGVTVHAGDTSFGRSEQTTDIIRQLNGNHIFLKGCHDKWMKKGNARLWIRKVKGVFLVVGHYPHRTWFASYHGSINLHGHSHGKLPPANNQLDIGVDNNNFYPFSVDVVFEKIDDINNNINTEQFRLPELYDIISYAQHKFLPREDNLCYNCGLSKEHPIHI